MKKIKVNYKKRASWRKIEAQERRVLKDEQKTSSSDGVHPV